MGLASWANRYQPPGNCVIVVSTMKWLRENFHFGFLVGNIPVTPADVASFDQVRGAARQVNNVCVAPPPQGDGWGGMLVSRRSTYHNIAERSMRSTITVVADFPCSQQHHITLKPLELRTHYCLKNCVKPTSYVIVKCPKRAAMLL